MAAVITSHVRTLTTVSSWLVGTVLFVGVVALSIFPREQEFTGELSLDASTDIDQSFGQLSGVSATTASESEVVLGSNVEFPLEASISNIAAVELDANALVVVEETSNSEAKARVANREQQVARAEPGNGSEGLVDSVGTETLESSGLTASPVSNFAWVRLDQEVRLHEVQPYLERMGVEVVGSSNNLVRLRLPPEPGIRNAVSNLTSAIGDGIVPDPYRPPVGSVGDDVDEIDISNIDLPTIAAVEHRDYRFWLDQSEQTFAWSFYPTRDLYGVVGLDPNSRFGLFSGDMSYGEYPHGRFTEEQDWDDKIERFPVEIPNNLSTDERHGIKFIAQIVDGGHDARGNIVQFGNFAEDQVILTLHDSGTTLFTSSRDGLTVFDRDPETGHLTQTQKLDAQHMGEDVDFSRGILEWDAHRSRLYALDCNNGNMHAFSSVDGSSESLRLNGSSEVVSTGFSNVKGVCNGQSGHSTSPEAWLSPEGSSFYVWPRLSEGQVLVFSFDDASDLVLEQELEGVGVIHNLVPTSNGDLIHMGESSSRSTLRRDVVTGQLTRIPGQTVELDDGFHRSYALTPFDELLVAVEKRMDERTQTGLNIYSDSLEESGNIREQLPHYAPAEVDWPCSVHSRTDRAVFDAFCPEVAYVFKLDNATRQFQILDYVQEGFDDKFGNDLPELDHASAVVSPDGKHVYVAGAQGVTIFERTGNKIKQLNTGIPGGYARLDTLEVSLNSVRFNKESSSAGCISMNYNDQSTGDFTVVGSHWQTKPSIGGRWTALAGTDRTGAICSITPDDQRLYRLVAEISIEGEKGNYASNIITQIGEERTVRPVR